MEAIAKHDFQATADDELSFYRGAKLKVGENIISYTLKKLFSLWCILVLEYTIANAMYLPILNICS